MKLEYIAYLFIMIFFGMDFIIRKDKQAKSTSKTKDDHDSTKYIIFTFSIIILSTEVLKYFQIGEFNNWVIAIMALAIMILGLVIRINSMLTLKESYTRILITTNQQELIRAGIYKTIRHPGYLGTILIWMSIGVAIENYIVAIISSVLIIFTYFFRIISEEKMLANQFEEKYRTYKKVSWRLIPYVW